VIRALILAATLVVAGPALGPALAAVEIQEVESPGGITAWLVEEPSIPFVALEVRFQGGAALDPEGKRGVTNLMMALIEEGAGDMDARAFAAARESLAASYEFDAYDDAVSISARFLTENRDEAIALLREALIDPRFDPDAIERVRAQVLSIIRSDAQDPNSIAAQTFDELVFGDHPYGSSRDGTLDSVAALTRDDIVAAHQTVLNRANMFVGVAGDITPEELGPLLDRLLGDLPEGTRIEVADAPYLLEGGKTVVPFDTPQSVAFFGHRGIKRDDPDFFAAFVANEVFGGRGLQSRLSDEVREKRGLTYGIGTFLAELDGAPLLLGQTATENARMGESIDVIKAEWARAAAEGFTEDEVAEAKTYLTGAYPLRFDGNGPIAGIMVGMQMEGLPIDYIETRNDKVSAVTLEDVNRVAAELYDPEALHFVVVGRPEGLEPSN
jgi:zinc protease